MPPRNPNSPPEGGEQPQSSQQKASEVPQTETREQLEARVKALEAELERSNAARVIAEDESARIQAQAQTSLLTSNVTERFAGEEDGKQMWWYRIDLAPCGGTEIRINGMPYYHGSTYKFETDLLRSIKEIVARTWSHENSINGANENPYKQAQNKLLGGGRAPGWAYH